jgi:hypothetical protein
MDSPHSGSPDAGKNNTTTNVADVGRGVAAQASPILKEGPEPSK